jgi:hypothetical protein
VSCERARGGGSLISNFSSFNFSLHLLLLEMDELTGLPLAFGKRAPAQKQKDLSRLDNTKRSVTSPSLRFPPRLTLTC